MNLIHGGKPASLDDAQKAYEEVQSDAETWGDLQAELTDRFGCAIQPDKTFSAFYKQINERTFMLDNLSQAFRDIESASGGVYAGLFDDFDIHSKDLGTTPDKRNALLSDVISKLADIDFNLYQEDALGDAYEYLISQFASVVRYRKLVSSIPRNQYHILSPVLLPLAKIRSLALASMIQHVDQALYCCRLETTLAMLGNQG